ncbi:hypothetical protein DXN04_13960 [Chitinophaga silvisoli]|uniref:Uncharacterized protein n=1 Tax=Chitinophaga silvisoli TaxID=2291814 RepID=A0A3E1P2G1_9BACT|nr:hypothetical protein DXN04_13960 [Chitinophaga silvisoli]
MTRFAYTALTLMTYVRVNRTEISQAVTVIPGITSIDLIAQIITFLTGEIAGIITTSLTGAITEAIAGTITIITILTGIITTTTSPAE